MLRKNRSWLVSFSKNQQQEYLDNLFLIRELRTTFPMYDSVCLNRCCKHLNGLSHDRTTGQLLHVQLNYTFINLLDCFCSYGVVVATVHAINLFSWPVSLRKSNETILMLPQAIRCLYVAIDLSIFYLSCLQMSWLLVCTDRDRL